MTTGESGNPTEQSGQCQILKKRALSYKSKKMELSKDHLEDG
jgi:hypothetical protein